MGNADSKAVKLSSSPKRKEAFLRISSNKKVISKGDISKVWHDQIGEDLSNTLDELLSDADYTAYDYIATNILQSNFHEKSEALVKLLGLNGVISRIKLLEFLVAVITSVVHICQRTKDKNFSSWKSASNNKDDAQILAAYFVQLAGENKTDFNSADIRSILVSADTLITLTFSHVFGEPPPNTFFPKWIRQVADADRDLPRSSLLTVADILFLNSELPLDWQSEWRLLFSTKIHGESFARFSGQIVNQGPTLIVIEDKDGYIFGAFAPANWSLNPRYFGNSSCFLFTLRPEMSVCCASNFNENYQYLTTGQQTLPNGLGFGGCLEYFGLWLSAEFGKGICNDSCTTFRQFKRLSKEKEFVCHNVETWGVGEAPLSSAELGERSVLDSNLEAKAMLEMAGRKTYSEGLREKPKD